MTGARVLVWDQQDTQRPPACVLEVTDDQVVAGRLRLAQRRFDLALREVERQRTALRDEVLRVRHRPRLPQPDQLHRQITPRHRRIQAPDTPSSAISHFTLKRADCGYTDKKPEDRAIPVSNTVS